ncbi:GNAT family N-acetyltransferase [Streptomyces sp. NPDC093225]|uniref:GNAT family N-acetyltransferase n=1 Tax=Streptomyces sp. NPDC093225 TaxID=3366034 RepID=UPI003807243F
MTFDQDAAPDPDRRRLLARYDREMRLGARPDGTGAVVEATGRVVRQTSPPPGWNAVLWSDLDGTTADAEIAAQVAHYAALDGGAGRPFEWKLYSHDGPADLGARLAAAGLEPGEPETMMVARVADLPREPELAPDLRLVAVTDAAGVALMEEVHDRAFGVPRPDLTHQILTQLTERPDTIAAVVALAATPDGERPVSAARLEMTPGTAFAGLWGGGTVAEWRGRGIYRALVAYRAAVAAARGIPYLQVDASPMSRPILERLGFTALTTTQEYNWAPTTPTSYAGPDPSVTTPSPPASPPAPAPAPAPTERGATS